MTQSTELKCRIKFHGERSRAIFFLTQDNNDAEKEQQRRLQTMAIACNRHNNKAKLRRDPRTERRYLMHVLVDDVHKVMYCIIPKVGSSNWLRVFIALKMDPVVQPQPIKYNDVHARHGYKHLRAYKGTERDYRLRTYTKFLFVRNPYERLLSAFKCSLGQAPERLGEKYRILYGTFKRFLVDHYRNNASNLNLNTTDQNINVTFGEFVSYLTDPRTLVADPFSINTDGVINPHWAPVQELCNPCEVQYDVIGKHETMAADVEYVLKRMRVDRIVKFPSYGHTANKTRSLMKDYYDQVNDKQLSKIRDLYEMDFRLFGYNDENLQR